MDTAGLAVSNICTANVLFLWLDKPTLILCNAVAALHICICALCLCQYGWAGLDLLLLHSCRFMLLPIQDTAYGYGVG